MKSGTLTNTELRELIAKGLELAFKKLLKSRRQIGGSLVSYENGEIKKIKASDIPD